MFGLDHPELLVFGVGPDTAARLLNNLGTMIKSGEHFVAGVEIDFEDWPHKVVPEPVPNPGEIVSGPTGSTGGRMSSRSGCCS